MENMEKPNRHKLVPDPALHGAGGVTFEPMKYKGGSVDSEECPVSPASQGTLVSLYWQAARRAKNGETECKYRVEVLLVLW